MKALRLPGSEGTIEGFVVQTDAKYQSAESTPSLSDEKSWAGVMRLWSVYAVPSNAPYGIVDARILAVRLREMSQRDEEFRSQKLVCLCHFKNRSIMYLT